MDIIRNIRLMLSKMLGKEIFATVDDISTLVVPEEKQNYIVSVLESDVNKGVYGGGFITIKKDILKHEAKLEDIYPVPSWLGVSNSYDIIDFFGVWSSEWFEGLKEQLMRQNEQIGFEYYTVPKKLSRNEIREYRKKHLDFGIAIKTSPFVYGSNIRNWLGEAFVFFDETGKLNIDAYAPAGKQNKADNADYDRFSKARKNKMLEVMLL